MKKSYRLPIILVSVVVVIVVLRFLSGFESENFNRALASTITIGGQEIAVEIAYTPALQAQGLSGRDPLPAGTGMLFVFPDSARHGFWMKDMKFSIDIIWIQDDTIVDIWADAPIPADGNIQAYSPEAEANYVLEVNAGFTAENDVNVGDIVVIAIR